MALTKNLKCTGQARRIELEDERDNLERQINAPRPDPIPCTVCGNPVEDAPMRPDLCYDCYRDAVQAIDEQRGPQWTPEVFAAGEVYDATPCPPQPVIVFDDVEEFPF